MYALLPVLVLMERKFPPRDIEKSHSKFTCDALLMIMIKCRCRCPATAKATHMRSGDAKPAGANYNRGVAAAILQHLLHEMRIVLQLCGTTKTFNN